MNNLKNLDAKIRKMQPMEKLHYPKADCIFQKVRTKRTKYKTFPMGLDEYRERKKGPAQQRVKSYGKEKNM